MVTINQLRTNFWHMDPGYLNLKQAVKTVLAVLLALWWVQDESLLIKVIAGVTSGTSSQGVVAKSFITRLAHVVVFDVIYFLALALGFIVREFHLWTSILLVVWGFLVNYIRRFGLDNSKAPMMAWVLCFLATTIPIIDSVELRLLIHAVLVGFTTSAIVILFVFPDNYSHLYINNSNRFFQNLAQGLEEMRRYAELEQISFSKSAFVLRAATLEKLLSSNQVIQQSTIFAKVEKQVNHILMHQHALLNAYCLLIDVYRGLVKRKVQLPREAVFALDFIHKEFARLFFSTKTSADYSVYSNSPGIILPNLAEKMGHVTLTEPSIIMALLNIKLSFDLLSRHEMHLLRGKDET